MICPMILQGLMANPSITSTNGDGEFSQTYWGIESDCQKESCAWWTGEQCAVAAIAKNTKPLGTVFAYGVDLAKEQQTVSNTVTVSAK